MSDVTDLKAEVLLLRQENKELRADQVHWELGNCPNCPNVVSLQEVLEQNAKLLWLVNDMCACFRIGAERDGVSKQWCYELFDTYTRKLHELGIEVPS